MPGFNPFRYRFPYTNLNDINLDWLIKKVRKLSEDVATLNPERMEEIAQQAAAAEQTAQDALETAEGVSGIASDAETIARAAQTTANNAADSAQTAGTAAAAAQTTANNAADSAQTAGTAAAAAQTTANNAADALATYVRPNLVDNWYFVGGGSQLGYGIFPVNQRGNTTYNSAGFTVDRWAINATEAVTLLAGGAKIQHNSTNQVWMFWQYINCASIVGKTITISRKIVGRQGSNITTVFQFVDSGGSGFGFTSIPDSGTESFLTYTTTVPSNAARIRVGIFASAGVASGDYVTLESIKMEIGSSQTLAHQENGAWVLNEVPDYAEQLAKCQAYYIQFTNYTAPGYITTGSTNYRMKITLPVSMARVPTPTITSYVCRLVSGGYSAHTGAYPGATPTTLWIDPNYGTSNFSIQDTINEASTDLNNTPCIFEVYGLQLTAEN